MQLTAASIMNRAMANPDIVALGLVIGYILAKIQSRRSGMGGMGGGL